MDGFEKRGFEETVNMSDSNEIVLELESYNDLFSSFDPREYQEKSLSVDFLSELKRASKDKESVKKIVLLVPKDKRVASHESVIKRRLKDHFHRHFNLSKKERGTIVRRGSLFAVFGILIMFLATFLLFKTGESNLLSAFMVVLLEPAGWFLFWEGLDLVIFESKNSTPEFKFYEKMTENDIYFRGF